MTRTIQITPLLSFGTRLFWVLEYWGLRRIDAWGSGYIVGTLVLVTHNALTIKTGLLVATIAANYWLGFWLNDYFDAPHDRNDESKARLNLFVQQPSAHKLVGFVTGFIIAISAALFFSFGPRGIFTLLVSLLVMWAYSAPPWRLKSRPGWDLLIHALFVLTWPYAVCLWLSGAAWTKLDTILIAGCFLVSLNSQLNQQIRDFAVDSRTDTNFTTRFGLARSILFLKASTLSVIVLFLLAVIMGNIPWLLIPFGLGLLPSFAHYLQHTFDNSNRILPRRIVYVFMILALIYTNFLIVLKGAL